MRRDIAIFDLDGTLLDTLHDLYLTCNHVLAAHDMPARSEAQVQRYVGNGYYNLLRRAMPAGTTPETIEAAVDEFNAYYVQHCEEHTGPYQGIPECLAALKVAGARIAVVSNKGDAAVKELVPHYFGQLVDVCVGERPGIRRKPAPDSVNEVMRQFGATRERCVYIGDSDVDIRTAAAAGMPCVSVTWGFRSEPFLVARGAMNLARTPAELQLLLLG